MTGKVTVFGPYKHFGFLKPSDSDDQIFFHENNLAPGHAPPEKGTLVRYDVGEYLGRKGAKNIRALTAQEVLEGAS